MQQTTPNVIRYKNITLFFKIKHNKNSVILENQLRPGLTNS